MEKDDDKWLEDIISDVGSSTVPDGDTPTSEEDISDKWESMYGDGDDIVVDDIEPLDLPETDDMLELCRAGSVPLMRRAIQLAYNSGNVKQVMAVLAEVNNRAYGKVPQAIVQENKIEVTLRKLVDEMVDMPLIEVGADAVLVEGGDGE